ncbi:prepilin-type N-terminal cleavage/methylation domain-containing protein [Priestia filamentosa]|uniref:type II secretion system protein n=1 Tax=Priestia filamentosa TaxID=1402861 RepID=UPI00397C6A97
MKRIKDYFSTVKHNLKQQSGFTLLELIAVIAILGIIAAISFTAFSNQGEKARVSAHETNVTTIEQAASRYETEKGFSDTDFKVIDKDHPLVVNGYLKEVPKNPWASTNKDQKDYKYGVTKDKRGMFYAYLISDETPKKIVKVESEKATTLTSGGASDTPKFVTTLSDTSADNERLFNAN